MELGIAAEAGGDLATAITKYREAQIRLAAIPDTQRNAGGGGQENMTWDRVAISKAIERAQMQLNSKTGIGVTNVVICPLHSQGVSQAGIW